jgi:glutathione S-transferase
VIELYQFAFSHFCEKARWALDFKGLPYATHNLLPGAHKDVARRLAPKSCLPILIDDGTVIQDSAAILSFLDEKYPERPLTPADPAEARAAVEWEQFLDREIGVTLRLWFYHHTLPDRRRALRFLLDGTPWYRRPAFVWAFPRVRAAMVRGMNIDADSAGNAQLRLLTGLARLDESLQDRAFLVGERFSRADLTACALLAPYCRIGESDAEACSILPEPLSTLRAEHKARRFFGWVAETYAQNRAPARN